MKKVFVIALLFLTTSAFCDIRGKQNESYSGELVYFSGGYSQSLNGTTPVGDLSIGMSFYPFENYGLQVGIDILHFQIAPTDRIQTVSDESLLQLLSLPLALPFSLSYSKKDEIIIERYFYIVGSIFFLVHGSLYFPVVPNSYFGFVNKHRLITEMITKGIHKESFTFQDDIGLRLQITPEGHYGFFIDGGFRFEKNFDRDFEKKWFAQAALTLYK